MQVSPMISTLLAGLIILLSLHAVDSLSPRRSEPRLLTLPIRPIPRPTNIHPQILLQMDINRGTRRLAMMTGAAPPSERSLQQRIVKRMLSLDVQSGIDRRFNRLGIHNVGGVQLEKRFNQVGVLNPKRVETRQLIKDPEPPTAANSLGLAIENLDTGYLATVLIGTPPNPFNVLVDSGSADFWVGGEQCKEVQIVRKLPQATKKGCGPHPRVGPSSSSFKNLSKPFQVTYGTGLVEGNTITDAISFADFNITLKFGAANVESVDFTRTPIDGLMGFAQSKLSQQRVPTFVEALVNLGLIDKAVTAYKLGRFLDGKNDGEISFGGLDSTKFKPNTQVILPNINDHGFWECDMDALIVNDRNFELDDQSAILDTGTTLVLAPPDVAQSIHDNIPGAQSDGIGGFNVPCNSSTIVAFVFGGRRFNIDTRDMVRNQVVNNTDLMCVSGIATFFGGTTPNQWLVGDVFLKNAYYSHEIGENGESTISLAELV